MLPIICGIQYSETLIPANISLTSPCGMPIMIPNKVLMIGAATNLVVGNPLLSNNSQEMDKFADLEWILVSIDKLR